MATINNRVLKPKNIEACTHLSKLNNSSQETLGINCPGVEHSNKIVIAQITENRPQLL